jgi:hypothetical protein
MNMQHQHTEPDHGRRQNLALWVFLAIILYFLVTEHWAHIVPFLPYALLLACLLLHLFMHGGHGGHRRHGERGEDDGHRHDEQEGSRHG